MRRAESADERYYRWVVQPQRARARRWNARGRARVSHPGYDSVVVPCGSPLQAVMCAAEVWGVDWGTVLEAEVWAVREAFEPSRTERMERSDGQNPRRGESPGWICSESKRSRSS